MLAVQGGNALEGGSPDRWPAQLTRVTLVHLTSSVYGESSCPLRLLHPARGLTAAGAELVEALNERRVWVDLAHAHPRTFWAALEHHSPQLPPIVTHTGVSGVKPIWRNLSDEQVRAIADRGGVIGVIFSEHFLKPSRRADGLECIALHLEHLQRIGGERCAALGSDYDGAIVPPRAIAGGQYPLLIQLLLDRGWSAERIQGVLGKNYLKSWESLLS